MNMLFNVWNKLEMKMMKGCYDLYLKCDVLLLAFFLTKYMLQWYQQTKQLTMNKNLKNINTSTY